MDAEVVAAIVGTLLALFFGGWGWWRVKRAEAERELLNAGLAIHALREAWILEGHDYLDAILHDLRGAKLQDNGFSLRNVEVRVVLDQARWNLCDGNQSYGFIDDKRTWIVRDMVLYEDKKDEEGEDIREFITDYGKPARGRYYDPHPALLSSRAVHELASWIELVASANSSLLLSPRARRTLWPLLSCVSGEMRRLTFYKRISEKAHRFLHDYQRTYAQDPDNPQYRQGLLGMKPLLTQRLFLPHHKRYRSVAQIANIVDKAKRMKVAASKEFS